MKKNIKSYLKREIILSSFNTGGNLWELLSEKKI